MKLMLVVWVLTVTLFVDGCGGAIVASRTETKREMGASTLPEPSGREADGDADGPTPDSYYDGDDLTFRAYGAAASTSDARAVSALVTRYYAAAVTDDGVAACEMIGLVFAGRMIAQYRRAAAVLRGRTCQAIAATVFRQLHTQLSVDNATLKVGPVRVSGNRGYAFVGVEGTLPRSYLVIEREAGAWKVASLVETMLG